MRKTILAYFGGILLGLIGAAISYGFGANVGTSIGLGYVGIFSAYNTIFNTLDD